MYEAVLHGCTADAGTGGAEVTQLSALLCLEGAPRNAWVALSSWPAVQHRAVWAARWS